MQDHPTLVLVELDYGSSRRYLQFPYFGLRVDVSKYGWDYSPIYDDSSLMHYSLSRNLGFGQTLHGILGCRGIVAQTVLRYRMGA